MQGLPVSFAVYATHAQTVTALPAGTSVLACNSFEPHHALAFGKNAWGFQFHPEFTADIVRMYIERSRDSWRKRVAMRQLCWTPLRKALRGTDIETVYRHGCRLNPDQNSGR
jgi:GMP synthase-like glutamine amidotransferase